MPCDLELLDPRRLSAVELAREVDEARSAVGRASPHSSRRLAEQRRELARRADRVLDQEGGREDRRGVLGDGELGAVAVGDRAALGDQVDVLDLLVAASLFSAPPLNASR